MSDMTITVWLCDECSYWRKAKTTGVHMANDPENPHGRLLTHTLREARFVPEAELAAAREALRVIADGRWNVGRERYVDVRTSARQALASSAGVAAAEEDA